MISETGFHGEKFSRNRNFRNRTVSLRFQGRSKSEMLTPAVTATAPCTVVAYKLQGWNRTFDMKVKERPETATATRSIS